MKAKTIGLITMLFLFGTTWAQDMSIPAKTSENFAKGDCFVLSGESFEYGLVYSGYTDVPEGMDTTYIGTKVFSFIPILLNSEEEGFGQFLQGSISIRCLDMEGPQCGYYEFLSDNKDGAIDTLLSQLEYVGAVNFPTSYHRDMASGGNIKDAASFKALFDKYWQADLMEGDEWKLYRFIDVMTLQKGLTFSSFSQD